MKQFIYYLTPLFLLTAATLQAQVPAPAPPQEQPVVVRNVSIHTGTGEVIEDGAIAFIEGKLTFVGKDSDFEAGATRYDELDGTGKHVYPGLILPNTILGLEEIGAVDATQDQQEAGSFNPEVRSIVAYNTDSHLIPTLRSNGILLAQITPRGGLVSGTSSLVQTDAWNWEDAIVRSGDGIHINFPNKTLPPRWWLNETRARKNPKFDQLIDALRKALREGKAYAENPAGETNLKLEAMKGLYDSTKTAYLHTNYAEGMVQGVQLLKEEGVKNIVLVGGAEALYAKDFLVKENIPLVLRNVHSLPFREDEPVNQPYSLPKLLTEAGVKLALGYEGAMNARNLPFFAGTAAAFGLEKEKALQLVTKNPAEMLGVGDRLGTLEVSKAATLLIASGDLFDMRSSQLEHAFIDGRHVSLDNKHKQLYRKFRKKYMREEGK